MSGLSLPAGAMVSVGGRRFSRSKALGSLPSQVLGKPDGIIKLICFKGRPYVRCIGG